MSRTPPPPGGSTAPEGHTHHGPPAYNESGWPPYAMRQPRQHVSSNDQWHATTGVSQSQPADARTSVRKTSRNHPLGPPRQITAPSSELESPRAFHKAQAQRVNLLSDQNPVPRPRALASNVDDLSGGRLSYDTLVERHQPSDVCARTKGADIL